MASDDIEVTALRDFTLSKGRKVAKGDTFTLPNYDARALFIAKLAVRTGATSPGLYKRRDMQAEQLTRTENATLPKATRQVDAEGSSPARRGSRS